MERGITFTDDEEIEIIKKALCLYHAKTYRDCTMLVGDESDFGKVNRLEKKTKEMAREVYKEAEGHDMSEAFFVDLEPDQIEPRDFTNETFE